MIIDPATVDGELDLRADACVIGSGAGGAVVAKEIAETGHSVILLEEGTYSAGTDFTQRETSTYRHLFREQASRASADLTVLVLQGRAVGGSTVPGFCLCFRIPPPVLAQWSQRYHLTGIDADGMAPHFERVEKAINAHPMGEADVNANNAKLRLGARELGLRGRLADHNRIDCVGCGYCVLGCSYDRKAGPLATYLPAAWKAGAALLPGCRVVKIDVDGGRATGIRGVVSGPNGPHSVTVRARAVILAAGAIASARLWLHSRLPNTHGQVGRHLHLHPRVPIAAVFDEDIRGWEGIPQSYVVDEYLRLGTAKDGGYLITPIFAHPVACASLLPGVGATHRRLMESYSRLAMASIALHDQTAGRVEINSDGGPVISYHLGDEDRADLLDGMRRTADIYFAAGAKRVVLPYTEMVELTRQGDYQPIDERGFRANDPLLISYEPHGTLRMGADPAHSVVDVHGEAHETKGLFVADASIFPESTAVPPQVGVMAFATRIAEGIAARLGV